ncbi:MAG: hypothetical protein ACJASC_002450 [Limimaricola cinnabarinus]|jgi:hypothetical protein
MLECFFVPNARANAGEAPPVAVISLHSNRDMAERQGYYAFSTKVLIRIAFSP